MEDMLDEYMRQTVLFYFWPYFMIGGHKDKFKELMICRPK
jgi:hypothetical protein